MHIACSTSRYNRYQFRVVCPLQGRKVNAPSAVLAPSLMELVLQAQCGHYLEGKTTRKSGILPFPGFVHFHTSWPGEAQLRLYHLGIISTGMLRVEEWGSGRRRTRQRKGKGEEWRNRVLLGKRSQENAPSHNFSQTVSNWEWSRNSYTFLLPAFQVDTCNMVFTCKRQSGLLHKLFQTQTQ